MSTAPNLTAIPDGETGPAAPVDGRPKLPPLKVRWRADSAPKVDDRGNTSARFVPYITQETCADLLDEWVGPFSWHAEFRPDGKSMWCDIVIVNPDGVHVRKTDVGDCVDLKSGTSDSFKRCATRQWGVGREVKSLPNIWAPCRTYTSNGREVAVANNNTLPTIRRKLASLGHSGVGDEVDDAPEGATGEAQVSPPQPDPPEDSRADILALALDALGDHVANLEPVQTELWAVWKADHHGWHRTIEGVHAAQQTVAGLLAEQGDEPFGEPDDGGTQ